MPSSVPSVPSIKGKGKLGIGIRAPIATAGGTSTYIQSDNTKFFQPDGSSLYLIP
jgi:hypothetical protein